MHKMNKHGSFIFYNVSLLGAARRQQNIQLTCFAGFAVGKIGVKLA